jgi:hypothetical protein
MGNEYVDLYIAALNRISSLFLFRTMTVLSNLGSANCSIRKLFGLAFPVSVVYDDKLGSNSGRSLTRLNPHILQS